MSELTVALIGCSARKRLEPSLACNLYTGTLFRYARTWVEQHGWRWHILSARYGLLDPLRIIRPYDHRFRGPAPPEWVEAVWGALLERYAGRPVRFKMLAGRNYRDKLVQRIEDRAGWTVEVPLAGLGIGQQIAWLKANTTR